MSPGNDQLKKKVLEEGKGRDSRPQKGQNVKINLKTCLSDGTLVEEQSDLSFTLGDGDVIQVKWTILFKWKSKNGLISQSHKRFYIVCFIFLTSVSFSYSMKLFFQALDLTVMLMEMGEKALVQANAKYAYGERGRYGRTLK